MCIQSCSMSLFCSGTHSPPLFLHLCHYITQKLCVWPLSPQSHSPFFLSVYSLLLFPLLKLHISCQLICLHNSSHFSVSCSVRSQPIYVSTLSHFCFSFSLSLAADSIIGQVSPEGLLSRMQIEGTNTEAESEVGPLGLYNHLFS